MGAKLYVHSGSDARYPTYLTPCIINSSVSVKLAMSVIRELNCNCYIRNRVARGYSHQANFSELQQIYPGLDGLSTKSVM